MFAGLIWAWDYGCMAACGCGSMNLSIPAQFHSSCVLASPSLVVSTVVSYGLPLGPMMTAALLQDPGTRRSLIRTTKLPLSVPSVRLLPRTRCCYGNREDVREGVVTVEEGGQLWLLLLNSVTLSQLWILHHLHHLMEGTLA